MCIEREVMAHELVLSLLIPPLLGVDEIVDQLEKAGFLVSEFSMVADLDGSVLFLAFMLGKNGVFYPLEARYGAGELSIDGYAEFYSALAGGGSSSED